MCGLDSDRPCMGPFSYNEICENCQADNKDECSADCPRAKRRPIVLRDWNGGYGRKTAV